MLRNFSINKIQCGSLYQKSSRKVSGLSRNARLERREYRELLCAHATPASASRLAAYARKQYTCAVNNTACTDNTMTVIELSSVNRDSQKTPTLVTQLMFIPLMVKEIDRPSTVPIR